MNHKAGRNDSLIPPSPPINWANRIVAFVSAAAIIALPFIELELLPALLLREAFALAIGSAGSSHDKERKISFDHYMTLVEKEADRLAEPLLKKKPETLTDRDRIKLALLDDQGLIDSKIEAGMPHGLKADILMTQLIIATAQSGILSVHLAENFSFPRIYAECGSTDLPLDVLQGDKKRLQGLIDQNQGGSDVLPSKLAGSLVQAVTGKFTDGAASAALSVLFDVPDLKKAWDIVMAEAPKGSAEEFLDQVAGKLLPIYEEGFAIVRMAARRSLRQAGIPYESVIVPKPEGGTRHIVVPSWVTSAKRTTKPGCP